MKKILIILCFISSILKGQDSTYIKGIIMACHDGDSYSIKIGETSTWVRMAFIDCPEVYSPYVCATQDYGKEVGDLIRSELKGKEVFVKFIGIDIYNRPLVRLVLNGVDYNTQLVARGMAWVVKTKDMDKSEYKILIEYKKLALKNRIGLFVNPKAVSPELFRKRNKCKSK